MTVLDAPPTAPAVLGPRVRFGPALAAVYSAQVSRARHARAPLLFVATLQSLGILVLLRGVVATRDELTKQAVVAGATVLVVAFVALNLLAQRLGALRAAHALDHYATLPVPAAAVVLGIAASYATFTVPGTLVTAVTGALLYGLPLGNLWVLVPVVVVAGASLAGLGALAGLLLPRAELATLAGQLGMTAVLFLGVIPDQRLPGVLRVARALVPSSYAVDALAAALRPHPAWPGVAWHLAVAAAVGTVLLAVTPWAWRRAVGR